MQETEEEIPEIIEDTGNRLNRVLIGAGLVPAVLGVCIWLVVFGKTDDPDKAVADGGGSSGPGDRIHSRGTESYSGRTPESLQKGLTHDDPEVRLKTIRSASGHMSWKLLEPLVDEGLADRNRMVSRQTAGLIEQIISKPPDIEIEGGFSHFLINNMVNGTGKQKEYAWKVCESLGEKGDGCIPGFIGVLRDESQDPWARQEAARALGVIGSPAADAAISALAYVLKDPCPRISASAAFAIAQIGPPAALEAVPGMILGMKGTGEHVGYIQLALQKLCNRDSQCLESLVQALRHEKREIRKNAVAVFTGIDPERAAGVLSSLVSTLSDRAVQKDAVRTLVILAKSSKKIRDRLIELYLSSKNYAVREWMIQVFSKTGGKDMVEVLVYIVSGGSRPMKREAAFALKELGDISTLPDLQKALKEETDMTTKRAILKAVNRLIEIKMDRDFKRAIEKEKEEKLKKE